MTRKIKVGFIGAGAFVSAHHLLTVRDSDKMTIHAIADINKQLLNAHAAQMDIGYTTTDYKKILSDADIDIVIIGTKQDLHARLIIESLNAGKWAFCEKPMAQNDEESIAVLEAEKQNKAKLAIGFNRRFAPAYVKARELMQSVKRPWYLNYRLMCPYPNKSTFYNDQPHILYEGTHILDLVCWLLEERPTRVFMTGDRLNNNCCLMEFSDGSQVSFMCGTMGSYCHWKEQMELFGEYKAITVSDFTDMRVRGWLGEYDQIYPPYLHEHEAEVRKYGFDFYDVYKTAQTCRKEKENFRKLYNMEMEYVKRPQPLPFNVDNYSQQNPDLHMFYPDKGWRQSLEHFADCFIDNAVPGNADGKAGAVSTSLALTLLASLEAGMPMEFKGNPAF